MPATYVEEAGILLVEDNSMDVIMTKMALKKGGFLREPVVLDDGIPAMSLLRREGEYAEYSLPDLVILDLNLKRVDGPEVLNYIRHRPELQDVWVAILSSSPADIMASLATQANCYFSKPSDMNSYLNLGAEIMNS